MFKKIAMASVAVGALALNAPAALADDPQFGCSFRSVQQEDATGQNFEGAAAGYVAHTGPVTIRCEIRVNGTPASSTETGSGSNFATSQGRITFAAGDTDVVTFHAIATTEHGSHEKVYTTTVTQIPPQAVIDAINTLFYDVIDPTVCPVLADNAGTYGPVIINDQGDIYVETDPQWDCPPYDIWPPA